MPVRPNLQIRTEAQRRSIELRMNAPAEIKTAERLRKRLGGRIMAFIQQPRDDAASLSITVHSRTEAVRVIAIYSSGAMAQRIPAVVHVDGSRSQDPQCDGALAARSHARSLHLVACLRRQGDIAQARALLATAATWRTQETV